MNEHVIKGTRFELTDSGGTTRAALGFDEMGGAPGLRLYDNHGKMRLELSLVVTGMPVFRMYDGAGELEASLDPIGGQLTFTIYDADGEELFSAPPSERRSEGI